MRALQGLIKSTWIISDHSATEGVDRGGRAIALDLRREITAVSRIRGTRRILEDTRGHYDPPIRVRECTRGHAGVRTATPCRRLWTVRPRFKSRVPDQNPHTIPGHNWCPGGGPESQPDQTSALR